MSRFSLDAFALANEEWVIDEIWAAGQHNIYRTDGTNAAELYASASGLDYNGGFKWHVRNGLWLRITNNSGADAVLGYAGVVTKA